MNKEYTTIPCGISHYNNGMTSHLETESKDKIHVPATSKSMACIIRRLSNTKAVVRCLWCGKIFVTYYTKIKNNRGKYCSKNCVGKANGAMRILDKKGVLRKDCNCGKFNSNWQGGDFVDCEICGKPFWKYPSRDQATCSIKCGYERASLVRSGFLSPLKGRNFYNGIKRWRYLRQEVLERDNYMCQKCNISYKHYTSFLHVHHKIRLADGGLSNIENLITLCKQCHFELHNLAGDLRKI